jgi:hypothetical protein
MGDDAGSGGPVCRRCSGLSKEVHLSTEVEAKATNAFNNSACFVCGSGEDEHLVLMCDECPNEYHIGCLSPPLTALPEEDTWLCPKCCSTEETDEAHTSSFSNRVRLTFPAQACVQEECLVCGQVKRRETRETRETQVRETRDREIPCIQIPNGVVSSVHLLCVCKLV